MEIVLIRHGKPKIKLSGWLTADGFSQFIAQYNEVALDQTNPPPENVRALAKNCISTQCSQLRRSIESAEKLDKLTFIEYSSEFNEFEMPHTQGHLIRLPISFWVIYFRIGQLLGYSPNAESWTDIKARTLRCTDELIKQSKQYGSIVYIGHGLMNRGISNQLLKQGWNQEIKLNSGYWSTSVFKLD